MAERAFSPPRFPTYPLFALVVLISLGVLFVRSGITSDETKAPPTTTTAVTTSTSEAIKSWLLVHRDELFPTYDKAYIGTCVDSWAGAAPDGLCSRLVEDLGDHQIHLVGVFATDWGGDLLLERSAAGWSVIASSPWPALDDTSYLGPRWSPLTAIAGWWRDHAPERYAGADVVHLRACDEASQIPESTQVFVCSTLVQDDGDTRVYATGRAGQPADVVLLVTERVDHTWGVADDAPATDELPW